MFCPRCGTEVPPAARFCPACGNELAALPGAPAVAAPPPPAGIRCAHCGAELAAGKRFCTRCGQPAAAAASPRPAAPRAAPRAPQARLDGLQLGALAGLGVAVVGTTLDWASTPFGGISAWDGQGRFRIGDWLDFDNLDGLLVVAVVIAGAVGVLQTAIRWPRRPLPYLAAAAGAALVLLGALEWYYVTDVGGAGVDPGLGLYALIAGGAAAAGCAITRDRLTRPGSTGRPLSSRTPRR